MRQRDDNEGSDQRERAGLLVRLVDIERIGFYDAELWLRAWEAKADEIGWRRTSEGYWVEGERWIAGEILAGRRLS